MLKINVLASFFLENLYNPNTFLKFQINSGFKRIQRFRVLNGEIKSSLLRRPD